MDAARLYIEPNIVGQNLSIRIPKKALNCNHVKHMSLSCTLRTAEVSGMDLGDATGKYNNLRDLKRSLPGMVKKQPSTTFRSTLLHPRIYQKQCMSMHMGMYHHVKAQSFLTEVETKAFILVC